MSEVPLYRQIPDHIPSIPQTRTGNDTPPKEREERGGGGERKERERRLHHNLWLRERKRHVRPATRSVHTTVERVVCESNRDPSRTPTPAGGLGL